MLSLEAKVGAMSLAGLLALALIFFTLNGFQVGHQGYELKVNFQQVDGLKVGAAVRVAGVDVGKVSKLNLTNEGVVAYLRLADEVRIPQGSRFRIRTSGLMGDKYIEITPNHQGSDYLAAGKTAEGETPLDLEAVINQAAGTFQEVKTLVASLNEIVGQEEVKKAAQNSVLNIAQLTENLNKLALILNQMALDNQADIRSTVSNLQQMSENMQATSQEVRALAQGVEADGATAQRIQEILKNLEYSSKKATQIADDIQSLTGDQELKQDIKATVKQARETAEKTNKLLSGLQETKTSFYYEAQYLSQEKNKGKVENTVNMQISPNEKQFYLIGLTNQENKNKVNLQLGKRVNSSTAFKAGLFKDYMGVAVSKEFGKKFSLEGQLTNEENVHFNLKSHYYFRPNLSLTIQANNLLGKGRKETNFGLQQEF